MPDSPATSSSRLSRVYDTNKWEKQVDYMTAWLKHLHLHDPRPDENPPVALHRKDAAPRDNAAVWSACRKCYFYDGSNDFRACVLEFDVAVKAALLMKRNKGQPAAPAAAPAAAAEDAVGTAGRPPPPGSTLTDEDPEPNAKRQKTSSGDDPVVAAANPASRSQAPGPETPSTSSGSASSDGGKHDVDDGTTGTIGIVDEHKTKLPPSSSIERKLALCDIRAKRTTLSSLALGDADEVVVDTGAGGGRRSSCFFDGHTICSPGWLKHESRQVKSWAQGLACSPIDDPKRQRQTTQSERALLPFFMETEAAEENPSELCAKRSLYTASWLRRVLDAVEFSSQDGKTRKNVLADSGQHFTLGIVPTRERERCCISRATRSRPILTQILCRFLRFHEPDAEFSSIAVNKNAAASPHVDGGNMKGARSYGMAVVDEKHWGSNEESDAGKTFVVGEDGDCCYCGAGIWDETSAAAASIGFRTSKGQRGKQKMLAKSFPVGSVLPNKNRVVGFQACNFHHATVQSDAEILRPTELQRPAHPRPIVRRSDTSSGDRTRYFVGWFRHDRENEFCEKSPFDVLRRDAEVEVCEKANAASFDLCARLAGCPCLQLLGLGFWSSLLERSATLALIDCRWAEDRRRTLLSYGGVSIAPVVASAPSLNAGRCSKH